MFSKNTRGCTAKAASELASPPSSRSSARAPAGAIQSENMPQRTALAMAKAADARRPPCDQFVVAAEAPQRDQQAHQTRHRQRKDQRARQRVEKRPQNGKRAVADGHFEQPSRLAHEDDEGEYQQSQAGVCQNFANQIDRKSV